MQQQQIYVALLDQGKNTWRAVDAARVGDEGFRIISVNTDPKERWEYTTGQIVRCRVTQLPNGERVLVATHRIGGQGTPRPDVGEP